MSCRTVRISGVEFELFRTVMNRGLGVSGPIYVPIRGANPEDHR
jgi:hypothetical protein